MNSLRLAACRCGLANGNCATARSMSSAASTRPMLRNADENTKLRVTESWLQRSIDSTVVDDALCSIDKHYRSEWFRQLHGCHRRWKVPGTRFDEFVVFGSDSHVQPNVELTGAARLYRAASSD